MKRLALVFILFLAASVCATDVTNVIASPQELWLGDSLNLAATCLNNPLPIDRVYTNIAGPGVIIPALDFQSVGNNSYSTTIPGSYFDRRGAYNATVFCSVNGTEANSSTLFSISELTGSLTSVATPVYMGNTIEVDTTLKKNGNPLTAGITFSVYLDGVPQTLTLPPIFDSTKGWVLRLTTPTTAKNYSLQVNENYQGKTIQLTSQVEVRNSVDFFLTALQKNNLISGENITISLRSLNTGAPLVLTKDNLGITINSITAPIQSISQNNGNFNVVITTPTLSPGAYQLTASLNYNSTSYTDSDPVNYITTLTGKFLDYTGKPLAAQLTFYQSGSAIYRVNTLSDGTYTTQIVPGTYDVDMDFGDAFIHLSGASVNSFSDPIKYSYNPGLTIDGLSTSGVYTMGVTWGFSMATVTLDYKNINYDDAMQLRIFRCTNWNQNVCNNQWTKFTPIVNRDQNQVTFSTATLSTFAVGLEDAIKLTVNFDKTQYAKKDLIKLSGATYGQKQITDVAINMKILGTSIDQTFNSNSNGVFSYNFLGPEYEGSYTVLVTAKKYPYTSFNASYTINVKSVPDASVIFPGAVQVPAGGNHTEELRIINTGQTILTGIKLGMNLDSKYYKLLSTVDVLPVNGSATIPILFTAGENESATTLSASLKFTSNEVTTNKLFGFTITIPVDVSVGDTNAATGLAFAMPSFTLPTINGFAPIIIFAIAALGGAFLLKKMKTRAKSFSRPEHSNRSIKQNKTSEASQYLMEIKSYLNAKSGIKKLEDVTK